MSDETPVQPIEVIESPAQPLPAVPAVPASPPTGRLLQWWIGLFQKMSAAPVIQPLTGKPNPFAQTMPATAKDEAKNRLQLVLMHDRTQLSPTLIESMRDELVEVISKYVEIDKSALDLSLEQESNTIALVANISVVRAIAQKPPDETAQAG